MVQGTQSLLNPRGEYKINCPMAIFNDDSTHYIGKHADLLDRASFNIHLQSIVCTIRPLGRTLTSSSTEENVFELHIQNDSIIEHVHMMVYLEHPIPLAVHLDIKTMDHELALKIPPTP